MLTSMPVARPAQAPLPPQPSTFHGGARFESEVRSAASAVQSALRALFATLPIKLRRKVDLNKILGIDTKLASQVFQVLTAAEPLEAAVQIPGTPSMKRLAEAVRSRGMDATLIANVEKAGEGFETLIRTHATNRMEFASMVTAISARHEQATENAGGGFGLSAADAVEQIDMRQRKAVFNAMSHFTGTQVAATASAVFEFGAENSPSRRALFLRIKSGLRRLRLTGPLQIDSVDLRGDHDETRKLQPLGPLDPAAAKRYGAPLLPQFCTQPLPEISTRILEGWKRTDIENPPLGRQDAITVAFGDLWKGDKIQTDAEGRRWHELASFIAMPSQLTTLDILLHRPTSGQWLEGAVEAFSSPQAAYQPTARHLLARMTLPERIQHLGTALDAQIPEIPQYAEMVQHACKSQNWRPQDFDLYRLQIPYPLVHSFIMAKVFLK